MNSSLHHCWSESGCAYIEEAVYKSPQRLSSTPHNILDTLFRSRQILLGTTLNFCHTRCRRFSPTWRGGRSRSSLFGKSLRMLYFLLLTVSGYIDMFAWSWTRSATGVTDRYQSLQLLHTQQQMLQSSFPLFTTTLKSYENPSRASSPVSLTSSCLSRRLTSMASSSALSRALKPPTFAHFKCQSLTKGCKFAKPFQKSRPPSLSWLTMMLHGHVRFCHGYWHHSRTAK